MGSPIRRPVAAHINHRQSRNGLPSVLTHLPAVRAFAQSNVGYQRFDFIGALIERSDSLFSARNGQHLKPGVNQYAFDIHPDQWLILDEQN